MGFLIDTCVWIEVERGRLSPGDVASFTGDEPVYLSLATFNRKDFEDIPGMDLALLPAPQP